MSLKDKYTKLAIRFLKENNCYNKKSRESIFYDILNNDSLPHVYTIGFKRSLYIKFIENEFVNDVISLLDDRLNLVDYDDFIFNGIKFASKRSFIIYLIDAFYLSRGLTHLDRYLVTKNKIWIDISSYNILLNNFNDIKPIKKHLDFDELCF